MLCICISKVHNRLMAWYTLIRMGLTRNPQTNPCRAYTSTLAPPWYTYKMKCITYSIGCIFLHYYFLINLTLLSRVVNSNTFQSSFTRNIVFLTHKRVNISLGVVEKACWTTDQVEGIDQMRSAQVLRRLCVSVHTGDGQQEQQSTSLEPHCHGHADRKTGVCSFTDKTNIHLHAQSSINNTPVTIAFSVDLPSCWSLTCSWSRGQGKVEMVEERLLGTNSVSFSLLYMRLDRLCSLCLNQRKTNPVRKHTLTLLRDCPITRATLAVFAQPIHMYSWVMLRWWKTNTFWCSRRSSSLCCQSQVGIG